MTSKKPSIKNWLLLFAAVVGGLVVALIGVSAVAYGLGNMSFGDASGLALVLVTPLYLFGLVVTLAFMRALHLKMTGLVGFCAGGAATVMLVLVLRLLSSPSLYSTIQTLAKWETLLIVLTGAISGFVYASLTKLRAA